MSWELIALLGVLLMGVLGFRGLDLASLLAKLNKDRAKEKEIDKNDGKLEGLSASEANAQNKLNSVEAEEKEKSKDEALKFWNKK